MSLKGDLLQYARKYAHECLTVLLIPVTKVIADSLNLGAFLEQHGLDLRGFETLLLGVLVAIATVVVYFLSYRRRRRLGKAFYAEVAHDYYFYADREHYADFRGNFIYDFKNCSDIELAALPRDEFIWSEHPEKKRKVKFEILPKDGYLDYQFTDKAPKIEPFQWMFRRFDQPQFQVAWSPRVIPPVKPGSGIQYKVEVYTAGTEEDAFTKQGSQLGFPTNLPIQSAAVRAYAPEGYRFRLQSRPVSVIDMRTGANVPEVEAKLPKPKLRPDGSSVEWSLTDLPAGRRYWINYCLEKDGGSP